MNAIIMDEIGNSTVLKYKPISDIDLKFDEVRITVKATAVNYIDTLIRSGKMPPGMMPHLPFIPGVECIGIVKEIGQQVSAFKIGDKVAYFGKIGAATYAEQVITKQQELVKIAPSLDDLKAAVIPVNYATAYHMLHNIANITKEDTILVHAAAGGVGTAIIQLAKITGATVIASVGSEKKKKYILNEGADYAINYKEEDIGEKVKKITQGHGVQVSLNPIAGASMVSDLEILAPFGHLVIFGFIAGLPDEKLQEAMLNYFGHSLTVSYSDIYTLYKTDFEKLKAILRKLFDYLSKGEIDPKVFKDLALTEASKAHELLESGTVVGKLILVP